jgi:hypothetical protein
MMLKVSMLSLVLTFSCDHVLLAQEFPGVPVARYTNPDSRYELTIRVNSKELVYRDQLERFLASERLDKTTANLAELLFVNAHATDYRRMLKSENKSVRAVVAWKMSLNVFDVGTIGLPGRIQIGKIDGSQKAISVFRETVGAATQCDVPDEWIAFIQNSEYVDGKIAGEMVPLTATSSIQVVDVLQKNQRLRVRGRDIRFDGIQRGSKCTLLNEGVGSILVHAGHSENLESFECRYIGEKAKWRAELDTTWTGDVRFGEIWFYPCFAKSTDEIVIFYAMPDRFGIHVLSIKDGAELWSFSSLWPSTL